MIDMSREKFFESERRCEASFSSVGTWYHLFTSGKVIQAFLKDEEDFRYCVNLLAICCKEYSDLVLVAFAIMDNHIHLVLSGELSVINLFFATFRRRLARYLMVRYSFVLPKSFSPSIKVISDLKGLRNAIVYVNRNGYVAYPEFSPFSYPWGSGFCYFNVEPKANRLSCMTRDAQRKLMKSRISEAMEDVLIMDNGAIVPSSFCRIRFGMAMFRDAHNYFNLLSKGVESYSGIATDIEDGEFLTDQELFDELNRILKSKYSGLYIRDLSSAQKLDLARQLHFQYKSSNGQIRRLLNISQYDLNALFPNG